MSYSDLNNGTTNITFNRFLNTAQSSATDYTRSFTLNPVLSSEDEQHVNKATNLLQLLNLERKRKFTPKKRNVARPHNAFVCLGIKGKNVRKKKRFENGNLIDINLIGQSFDLIYSESVCDAISSLHR